MEDKIDNITHNDTTSKIDTRVVQPPNRRTRRALWKQDKKFKERYKNELSFLEKYVEENGLEELSKYLEEKNKDENESI